MSKFMAILAKNKASLFNGLGVGMLLSATVSMFDFVPMAIDAIEEEKERQNVDELSPIDTIKAVAPAMVTPAVLSIAGTSFVCAGNSEHLKNQAAAVAASALIETSAEVYKDQAKKILGERKEKSIQEAADKELYNREGSSGTGKSIVVNGTGDFLMWDSLTKQEIHNRIEVVKDIIVDLNYDLLDHDITLDEYCLRMNEECTDFGQHLVWKQEDLKKIKVRFTADISKNGEPFIIISHENIPKTY